MLSLPNGCRCSKPKVSKLTRGWKIWYRFYDPMFPKAKYVEFQSTLNTIDNLNERRLVAAKLIEDEIDKLQNLGYNPITGTFTIEPDIVYEIDPETPFIKALWKVKDKLPCGDEMKIDIKAALKIMEKAAEQLRLHALAINRVSLRHLTMLLDHCGNVNPKWSNRRHNMYRSYLIMIFKKLTKLEATQGNPAKELDILKTFRKMKVVASSVQRKQIGQHLKEHHYRYWLFVNLFYHSGGRMTELMQQTTLTVDLERQRYRCVVRKGRGGPREVERTIKDVALPYWRAFLEGAAPGQHLFGIDFLPASKPMSVDTPGRWWKRIVKDELKINIDFNSLRHLNADEMTALLGVEDTAKHNQHSEQILLGHYAVGEEERRHQRIKNVANEF